MFDPATVFEEFDLSGVRSAEERGNIREASEIEFGSQINFPNNPDEKTFKADFTKKDFHTFKDENLEPASAWRMLEVPQLPPQIEIQEAKKRLAQGEKILAVTGEEVIFDNDCLYHWQVEEKKAEEEVNSRLACLLMAVETVMQPLEIWNQGTQTGFIKVFQKETGGYRGCLVFVLNSSKVRTYFPKDLNSLDKARKGFSVRKFYGNGAD